MDIDHPDEIFADEPLFDQQQQQQQAIGENGRMLFRDHLEKSTSTRSINSNFSLNSLTSNSSKADFGKNVLNHAFPASGAGLLSSSSTPIPFQSNTPILQSITPTLQADDYLTGVNDYDGDEKRNHLKRSRNIPSGRGILKRSRDSEVVESNQLPAASNFDNEHDIIMGDSFKPHNHVNFNSNLVTTTVFNPFENEDFGDSISNNNFNNNNMSMETSNELKMAPAPPVPPKLYDNTAFDLDDNTYLFDLPPINNNNHSNMPINNFNININHNGISGGINTTFTTGKAPYLQNRRDTPSLYAGGIMSQDHLPPTEYGEINYASGVPYPSGYAKKERPSMLLSQKSVDNLYLQAADILESTTNKNNNQMDPNLKNLKAKRKPWTRQEDDLLRDAAKKYDYKNWKAIAECVPNRNDIQCSQRWSTVLKPGLKKGQFEDQEDKIILALVEEWYAKNPDKKIDWNFVTTHLPGRNPKSVRERWKSNLDPRVNKEDFSIEEDRIVLSEQRVVGNQWAKIAKKLNGRTEHLVKTRWKSINRKIKKAWNSERSEQLLAYHRQHEGNWDLIMNHFPNEEREYVITRYFQIVGKIHV
jgi:hypothetical protein